MPVPPDPPVAVTPVAFRDWALDVSDTAQDHETRIDTLELGGGGTIAVEDEGTEILASATRLDFTGTGVTVTDGGSGQATVTIPGPSSVAGVLLASHQYNPGTSAAVAASGTIADVDATNLAVTFTVPASGAVIVSMTARVSTDSSTTLAWALRQSTTTVTGSQANMSFSAGGHASRLTYRVKFTGLTPGASLTWKWAHLETFGATGLTVYGGAEGPALMEVWSA